MGGMGTRVLFGRTLPIYLVAACLCAFVAANHATAQEEVWRYKPPRGFIDCSPAAGDLDGDGVPELVIAAVRGHVAAVDGAGQELWRAAVRGLLNTPPTIANVTGGPGPEVIALEAHSVLACLDGRTGALLWDWPHRAGVEWGATAVTAYDFDGDGLCELVFGDSEGAVVCLSGAGDTIWTYHGDHGQTMCPAVGDVNGDGAPEVIVGGWKKPLVCLSESGDLLWKRDEDAHGASPVLADLNADGTLDIVAATDNLLTVFDGAGQVVWTHAMKRQMDSAITVVDADADGEPEIYAADLAGQVVRLSAAGELEWEGDVVERVRRSPTVADVDGDGVAEILVAGYSGSIHVFSPTGQLEATVALSGQSNASATVFLLGADKRPAVACPSTRGDIQVFQWADAKPDAQVLSPEYRGNAARTASLVPEGEDLGVAIASVDFGPCYVGANLIEVTIHNPHGHALVVTLEVTMSGGPPSANALRSSDTTIKHSLPYTVTGRVPEDIAMRAMVALDAGDGDAARPITQRTRRAHVIPFMREIVDCRRAIGALRAAAPRLRDSADLLLSADGFEARLPHLETRARVATAQTSEERRALRADLHNLLRRATRLNAEVQAVARAAGDAAASLVVTPANPWAPFGGMAELGEDRILDGPLTVAAFQGETESAALNVFNVTPKPVTLRVEVGPFVSGGQTVPAADAVTVHEVVAVPTRDDDLSADAIPELNQAQALLVPGWDGRQLWFEVHAGALTPGVWTAPVRLRTLEPDPQEVASEIRVTVWDAALPAEQPLSLCHWGYVHSSMLKDMPEAALADQVDHHTNVFVGLFYPRATFDESGAITSVDFEAHDAYVKAHAPHGIILFCGYQGALTGPGPREGEAYRKAHVAWLRAWVAHLRELGVGYDGFALYPVDEPGLRQGLVEVYLTYAKLAREADPAILMYTDPVDRIELDELKAMADYVDIWCPNRSGLILEEANAEKFAFIKGLGEVVWTYECAGNAKHQTPLGYYRAQAWLAWREDLTGIGFWSYCTSQDDPWYPPKATDDYLLVYQGDGVVASKRWEAVRDGVEDYGMLTVLRDAAAKAKAEGRAPEAVAASKRLLDAAAAEIAEFCDKEAKDLPSDAPGYADVRVQADVEWAEIQRVRAEIARLLTELGV
ncbi:MAG: PQQ-binding-like beta-propeller repeat protein [bacterium]|nr:PQQ-binding-like beta-propeller repeat protein [bacterium]